MSGAWEPPELALAVGDRVRVRLSGECGSWLHTRKALLGGECEHGGDGDEGVVQRVLAAPAAASHPYYVAFPPEAWADHAYCGASFARVELERTA